MKDWFDQDEFGSSVDGIELLQEPTSWPLGGIPGIGLQSHSQYAGKERVHCYSLK